MAKKFQVITTNQDYESGHYWTEVVGVYDDYEQAVDIAYQYHGYVEEVEG